MEDESFSKPKPTINSVKSLLPVTESFSTSFKDIIDLDLRSGLKYFERPSELETFLKALLKQEKPHTVIVGEPGTGKETLIKLAAYKISKGNVSLNLNNLRFYQLDLDSLVSGTKYRGQFEERLKAIEREVQINENIVFYMKDLFDYLTREGGSNLDIYHLKSLLNSKAKIITTLTAEQANFFFKKYNYLYHLFNIVRVNPPSTEDSKQILLHHKDRFETAYSVQIPISLNDEVIEYSNLYNADGNQPQKSITLLEEVCTTAELARFSNSNGLFDDIINEHEQLMRQLDLKMEQKKSAVERSQYEEANTFHSEEVSIRKRLLDLNDNVKAIGGKNRIELTKEDVVKAICVQTGIALDDVRSKKNVVKFSELNIRTEYTGLPKFEFLQTQSILHGHEVSITGGLAFVLLPFTSEFNDLYNFAIKPALEAHGLNVRKADDIYQPGNILSQIWELIRTAEVIIVDVSGQNSNVIFELGLCYGIQRCPILLTRNPNELPFNIRNLRYIQYLNTAAGANQLSQDLKTSVGEFLSAVRLE